jgi:spore coat protein U-like protein
MTVPSSWHTPRRAVLALTLTIVLAPAAARAATCSFTVVTPLAFGAYDAFRTSSTASVAMIEAECSKPADPMFTIDGGRSWTGTSRAMRHANGVDLLLYGLCLDAGCGTPWLPGQVISGTPVASPSPARDAYRLVLYGSVGALQDARVGSHADAVVITVQF